MRKGKSEEWASGDRNMEENFRTRGLQVNQMEERGTVRNSGLSSLSCGGLLGKGGDSTTWNLTATGGMTSSHLGPDKTQLQQEASRTWGCSRAQGLPTWKVPIRIPGQPQNFSCQSEVLTWSRKVGQKSEEVLRVGCKVKTAS